VSNERIYRTEAIVLRRRDQGEADRVLTLCTPLGKLALIAKGVRKVRSRKAGHLELFVHSRLIVARSRSSWDIISQAETVEPHAALRDDLLRGSYARYVAELYDRFVAEGEGDAGLFELLRRVMGHLCQTEQLDLLVRGYEQRLLALVGFRLEWERCVGEPGHACQPLLQPQGDALYGLDPERGGALCPTAFRASQGQPEVMPLSAAALRLLQACQQMPFSRLQEVPASPALLGEVERAARHAIAYYLEQEVRSEVFLRQLKRG